MGVSRGDCVIGVSKGELLSRGFRGVYICRFGYEGRTAEGVVEGELSVETGVTMSTSMSTSIESEDTEYGDR